MSKTKRKRELSEDNEKDVEQAVEEETPTSTSSRVALLAAYTGTGADLANSLKTSSLDALRTSLTNLRTLTSRNGNDERISPSDKRIQLAEEFCRAGGIGQLDQGQDSNRGGLINAWNLIDAQEQVSLLPVPLFVLSNLIYLLGSHQPTHDLCDEIIQTILPASASSSNVDSINSRQAAENRYWNRLQTYLSLSGGRNDVLVKGKSVQNKGSQDIVTMATLRLLLEITTFASGKYARTVFDHMNWTMKSLPRLLSMRRRTNNQKKAAKTTNKPKNAVTLDRPDIRTLWILFLLSFLGSNGGINQPVSLQIAALSLGKEFLPAILKGLSNDSPQIVVHILMELHATLISDDAATKLPRSKVVGFFSEWACKELLSLYEREADLVSIAATGEKHSIADVVHHFMLGLCTHAGKGICYVDQGWYGRQSSSSRNDNDDDDKEPQNEANGATSAVFNKVLLGLLRSLSPTRSLKQAELTLRILSASQELMNPFLQATTGSLSSASVEPRGVSIAWLSTAAFMGRVLSIPLPDASRWKAQPPSFDQCLHSLLPISLTKATLTRGIHNKDRLTRHGALVLLSRALDRLHRFKVLSQHMASVDSDDAEGEAYRINTEEISIKDKEDAIMRGEISSDIEKQNPWTLMCSNILEDARQRLPDLTAILTSIDLDTKQQKGEEEKDAARPHSLLIVEAALRSAHLHYQVFEEATTADLSRLLTNVSVSTMPGDDVSKGADIRQSLALVCRLHAIHLLTLYAQRNVGGVDLFIRHNSKEATTFRFLLSLATSTTLDQTRDASRILVKEAMLGTILFEHDVKEWQIWQYALDESSDALLDFFDESVQRCLKTPYRYIEMARAAMLDSQDTLCASPLFFVMAEQYFIRLQNGLWQDDDDAKLEFWHFTERYIPGLLALNGSKRTEPLLYILHSHTVEAIAKDDRRKTDGEERRLNEGSRTMLSNAYQRVERKFKLLAGRSFSESASSGEDLLQHSKKTALDNGLNGESEKSAAPMDLIWTASRGVLKEMSVNWDKLLFSPVETRMMLFFVKGLLASTTSSVEDANHLLQSTLAYGQFDAEEVIGLLRKELDVASTTGHLALSCIALLQATAEGPFDLDSIEDKLSLLVIPRDDSLDRQDGRTTHFFQALIKLYPVLSLPLQQKILQADLDLELLCEAASGFASSARGPQSGMLMTRLVQAVQKCKDSQTIRNCLLLMKEILDNIRLSPPPPPSGGDHIVITLDKEKKIQIVTSLLDRSDLSELDFVLCKVLPDDDELCSLFYTSIATRSDGANLVGLIPLTLSRVTKTLLLGRHTDLETTLNQHEALLKACIARIFDATPAVIIPLAEACLGIIKLSAVDTSQLQIILSEALPIRPSEAFKPSVLLLAKELLEQDSESWLASSFVHSLIDRSLLWLVRRFAEDEEDNVETIQGVEAFISLLEACLSSTSAGSTFSVKAHLAEPVLLAAVADRLSSRLHLRLIRLLMKLTQLKTALIERLIVDVFKSKSATTDETISSEIVAMIYDVAEKDATVCSADTMTSLVKLYKGGLSKLDRKVMKLLHLHESKQGISALSYLQNWEATPKQAVNEIDLGLVSRLDPIRVHETCLRFPRSRGFEDLFASGYTKHSIESNVQSAVYDPLLILSATGAVITKEESMSGLHWLELIRSNTLGVVVCCLSSRWSSIRRLAMNILAKVYNKVALASFQEKDHLLLILDFVRNSYELGDVQDATSPSPLPLTITLFVAHSLRSLGIPSLYLYPLISRFMLQRSTPDPTDVPLLYNFLYSSSAQSSTARSEKIFILRFLHACILYGGSSEWKIMKRRHVWDSICSLYTAGNIDDGIKRIIQDIFIAISTRSDLAFRVVVRHSWLNYILQVNLGEQQEEEEEEEEEEKSRRFWIKCIANMMESIDLDRMHSSAGGALILDHFASLLNHLLYIQEDSGTINDLDQFHNVLRAMIPLINRRMTVDLEVMLNSLHLLGSGWTRSAFTDNRLPFHDDGAMEDQINSKMLRNCKALVCSIKVALNDVHDPTSDDTTISSSAL